ncbi:TonB-dependent receptor plug domain-containing protein [Xanthomonas campestris]|uniref:TonB-dependent receptor plug domain-containing protein n=1 Tax=Xanthomonas campestris TaxID=339 RepID=UPI000B1B0DD4|nr:TonB-dependent receptor [Xanthomonas campestris]MEB2082714.1 TonB-dependent receptor [Xanthomonas campestris pv. campestris]MEB2165398.1 TonB-dependent receptor [Xanthomonas campestris pv. campestris]
MLRSRTLAVTGMLSTSLAVALPAFAEDREANSSTLVDKEFEVITVGSRFGGRSMLQSPTPVDLITREEMERNGRVDLLQMLKVEVPSFNIPRPIASGAGDYLMPPSLRGLGPGEVLVLINGKRRHTSADLNSSNGVGRGDISIDFNAIPSLALSRVEVLRDGAAAQYGSDAISGVINLTLARSLETVAHATYLATSKGDGQTHEVAAATGFPIGREGVVRLTAAVQDIAASNRARPDTRQQYFGANAAGAPVMPSGNYGSGTGLTAPNGRLDPLEAGFDRDVFFQGTQPSTNRQLFYNLVTPLSDAVEFYSFGGHSRLDGDITYFFRRAGQDETVRAIYPDGYSPMLDTRIDNTSVALGLRGPALAGFGWDLSTVYGRNTQDLFYANSVNVSLGAGSPTRFYRSGADFDQWTTNLDLNRELALGSFSPLRLALGAEHRYEQYRLLSGAEAGYINGGVHILDGPNAGRPAIPGSQPGPSNGPDDNALLDRNSQAIYVEVEQSPSDRLLLSAAARHERYSDFGNTTNVKIASRFQLSEQWALRGSYNTGFRAPALAQSGYNASNTLILNGAQAIVRVAAVGTEAAQLAGATDLKPETSNNISLGTVFQEGNWSASLDAYQIKVRDRIAISSTFQDPRLTNYLAANGQSGFAAISFLTNAVDTVTRGMDLVINYRRQFELGGALTGTFAGNYNTTDFDRIAGTPAPIAALGITTPLFDLTQQLRYSDSQPRDKLMLNLNYTHGRFSANLTNTRYGQVSSVALTGKNAAQVAVLTPGYDTRLVPASATNYDIIQTFSPKIITDLELSAQVTPALRVSIGAQNLLDVYPDENIASTAASVAVGTNGSDNAGTHPYNATSPFGFTGRALFMRAGLTF